MPGANPFDQFGYDNGGGSSAPVAAAAANASGIPNAPGVYPMPAGGMPPASASAAPSSSAPTASAANPFDKFGFDDGSGSANPSAKPQPTWTGLAANAAAGTNEGVTGFLGAPVDAMNWAEGKLGIPTSKTPFMGSQYLRNLEAEYGGSPDQVVPQTEAERVARGAGAGIAGALLPAGAVSGLARAGVLAGPALETAQAATGAADATNATIGAAAGAGGQAAADAAPDQWKPLAGVVGGLAAGGVPVAGSATAIGLKALGSHAIAALPAVTDAGREAAARATVNSEMRGAATNPSDAAENLATQPPEIVPGSQGTTAQIAGDPGLMGWEKAVAQTPEGKAALEQRATEQNNARQASLGALQPEGNTLELPAAIRQNAADAAQAADAQTQLADTVTAGRVAAAQKAQETAIQGLQSLKPNADPADLATQFRAVRDAMDQGTQAAVDQAQAAAGQARNAAAPQAANAETLGSNLREPVAGALAAAKANENQLWQAVDPTGRMVMPAQPISAAAQEVMRGMTESAVPMTGEEQRIFGVASAYGNQVPFRDVTDLRSSISQAMRDARVAGNAQSLRRLTILRGAVEDGIDNAVQHRAAVDQAAVASGFMSPEDTIGASLQREVDDWRLARAQATGTSSGGKVTPATSRGSSSLSRVGGTEGQGLGGPTNASSNSGLSGDDESPFLDAEAAGRLKAASTATRERHATFDQGNVGKILQPGQTAGTFKRSDAQVPALVFHKGPTAGEDIRNYLGAGGSVEHAVDAAAMSLREAATKADGTFDSKKTWDWMQDHKAALAELPEAARDKFLTTLTSQQAVEDAFAARRDTLSNFEKSEAGKVAGLSQPHDIVAHVGSIIDRGTTAVQRMTDLAQAAKGDPMAENGLKRAVVEHVIDKFIPEAGDPRVERLQAFLADKKDVLNKALSPDEVKALSDKTEQAVTAGKNLSVAQADRKTAMAQAEAAKAERLSPYQRGVLKNLIDANSTADVLDHLKGIFNVKGGAARMEKLAAEAAKVEGGSDALKRGIQELLQREFSSNTAAGATHVMQMRRDAFAEFVKDKGDALKAAGLSDDQMKRLEDIVEDGLRANRSISMTKARGGSDTEANRQAARLAGEKSILGRMAHEGAGHMAEAAGALAGERHGGLVGMILGGAAGWLGRSVIGSLREAGLNRIKELRVQAALDPDLGRTLLMAAPRKPDTNSAALLGMRARQLALAGSLGEARQMAPISNAQRAPDGRWYVQDAKRPGKFLRVVQAIPQALWDVFGKPVMNALTLPRDVYAGKVDPTSPHGIDRTLGLAALVAGGPHSLGTGENEANSLALSREAGYYPPDKSPRGFEEDYPSGAPSDGQGNLTHTIDGAPIVAPFVAGRRVARGPDEPLSAAQVVAGTTQTTGRSPQAIAPSTLSPRSVGSVILNPRSGRPELVSFSQDLSPADAEIVRAHEFGHVIDEIAGKIPLNGIQDELSRVYNDLNGPRDFRLDRQEKTGVPISKKFQTTPEDLGYSKLETPREYIVEAIRAYLQNPNYLKTVAPKTAAAIRKAVNSHPELSRAVQFNSAGNPVFLTSTDDNPFSEPKA